MNAEPGCWPFRRRPRRVMLTGPEGEKPTAFIVDPPGCWQTWWARLWFWLVRVLVVALAFAAGYGCRAWTGPS